MDNEAKRNAAPATLDHLLGHAVGDPRERYIKAIYRTALTIKYADVQADKPAVTSITPRDVVDYYWDHWDAGFHASARWLGPTMLGDWLPVDEEANICLRWFTGSCRAELIKAAAKHDMTLIS